MDLVAGEYEVRTESKASEAAVSKVRVEVGGQTTWHGFVDPGICLVGAIDFVEAPAAEGAENPEQADPPAIAIEASSSQGGALWVGVTLAQKDGGFFLPRCESSLLKVQFVQLEDGQVLRSEERALAGQHDWRIDLDAVERTTVTWVPQDGQGAGPGAAELRVWDGDMQRARFKNVGGRKGQPAAVSLTPGTWFLEMSSAGACTSGPIRVDVMQGAPLDLGPISMGPIAWLEIPEAPAGHEWVVVAEEDGGRRFVAYSGEGQVNESGQPMLVAVPPGVYRIEQWSKDPEEGEAATILDLGTVQLAALERQVLPTEAPAGKAGER